MFLRDLKKIYRKKLDFYVFNGCFKNERSLLQPIMTKFLLSEVVVMEF
jgi:hypothetical protein